MQLVDTHAHLEEIEDPAAAVAQARTAGVVAIIAVGSDMASNGQILQLAQAYPGFVYPALGYHPWNMREAGAAANVAFIREHIGEAIAVGEIGLDYHKKVRENADKALQKNVLAELLEIAGDAGKPALLHTRYAWRDAYEAVAGAGLEKAVFHWYTGTSGVLREIIEHGYYVSVTPAVEYHDEHRRAVREAPLERLLLETDAPVTYGRGSDHEFQAMPADVLRSLKGASVLKGIDAAELAAATTDNAIRLFELAEA
jgi:TatD DNase family protein